MAIKMTVDEFLYRKREKRRLQRLRSKKTNAGTKLAPDRVSSGLRAFRSQIRAKIKSVSKIEELRVDIPKTFSIIDEPSAAIDIFYSLVKNNDKYKKIRKIYFDHSPLQSYDLAAEQLLDHLAEEIRGERIRQKPKVRLLGAFPSDAKSSRFIRGIGILRKLGIADRYMSASEKKTLEIFDRMDNNALRKIRKSSEVTARDSAVERFTDHIENCLNRFGHRLTGQGRQDLGVVSGEVIDNAVEHSQGDGWVIAGYLDTNDPDNICEIAIFNFGISIAESLRALPIDHFTHKLIKPYIDAHSHQGLFGTGWTKDDLLTLVALQDNISSKNESNADTRGGGTIDIIEFFQQIYDECGSTCKSKPKMAILSGRTHIVFDGKYKLKPDKHGRPVIAFNKENRLDLEPDRSYFTHLKKYPFPGTAVCIRFPLQDYQYEKVEDIK